RQHAEDANGPEHRLHRGAQLGDALAQRGESGEHVAVVLVYLLTKGTDIRAQLADVFLNLVNAVTQRIDLGFSRFKGSHINLISALSKYRAHKCERSLRTSGVNELARRYRVTRASSMRMKVRRSRLCMRSTHARYCRWQ